MKAHFRLAYEYNTFMAFSSLSCGQDADIFICYLLGTQCPMKAGHKPRLPCHYYDDEWSLYDLPAVLSCVRSLHLHLHLKLQLQLRFSSSCKLLAVGCCLCWLYQFVFSHKTHNCQLRSQFLPWSVICDLRSASLEISEIAAIATRFATFWHAAAQMSKSWQRRTMNRSHCCFQLYGERKINELKQLKKQKKHTSIDYINNWRDCRKGQQSQSTLAETLNYFKFSSSVLHFELLSQQSCRYGK